MGGADRLQREGSTRGRAGTLSEAPTGTETCEKVTGRPGPLTDHPPWKVLWGQG